MRYYAHTEAPRHRESRRISSFSTGTVRDLRGANRQARRKGAENFSNRIERTWSSQDIRGLDLPVARRDESRKLKERIWDERRRDPESSSG
jgi:hypothetical protein